MYFVVEGICLCGAPRMFPVVSHADSARDRLLYWSSANPPSPYDQRRTRVAQAGLPWWTQKCSWRRQTESSSGTRCIYRFLLPPRRLVDADVAGFGRPPSLAFLLRGVAAVPGARQATPKVGLQFLCDDPPSLLVEKQSWIRLVGEVNFSPVPASSTTLWSLRFQNKRGTVS